MLTRILTADSLAAESCFLWGPRQTGKSTLLRTLFPRAPMYDLLSSREFRRLSADPGIFAEECAALPDKRQPVIIDEIQKLPALLAQSPCFPEVSGGGRPVERADRQLRHDLT
jgi:predicted AAA+ superfamily ATPase